MTAPFREVATFSTLGAVGTLLSSVANREKEGSLLVSEFYHIFYPVVKPLFSCYNGQHERNYQILPPLWRRDLRAFLDIQASYPTRQHLSDLREVWWGVC